MTGLALLPHLTVEELTELRIAVDVRMNMLASVVAQTFTNDDLRAEANRRGLILQSLSTAIAEALIDARRQDDDA